MAIITSAATLIVSGNAGKKLIEKIVEDLYNLAKSKIGLKLNKWKANNHTEVIYKRVRDLRLVKTIWQIEREVDLTSFYHPAKVFLGDKRVTVNQIADFEYDGNILIEGTVGQGKSIFLRYLASVDFCVSRRIPVFVELRRIRQGQTLLGMALQELKVLGFEMDETVFRFFAENGRLLLLLDAFDEVKEELRQDVVSELENLLRQHEPLRVVVTSRPESGIATSSLLRVFRLSPLEGREYESVINLMAHNEDTASAIINGIRKDSAQISKVLTTPLMVALLMVRYKIDQSLPQNDAAFYDSLFILLLQRHDKMKGGYVRPRKSGMSDTALLDMFNALCFVTRKANETSFTKNQLNNYSREASKLIGQNGDVEKILTDIIDITCLLITDGQECKFIHKSVQEYHAALFIKDQPEGFATIFYNAMSGKWKQWQHELRFLGTIDRYRFLKNFHIPQLKSILNIASDMPQNYSVNNQQIMQICGDDKLEVELEVGRYSKTLTYFGTSKHWPTARLIDDGFPYTQDIFKISRKDIELTVGPQQIRAEFTVSQLLNLNSCCQKAQQACGSLFALLFQELIASEGFVLQMEQRKSVLDF